MALINEHNPDVLCGCEFHLDESYLSAEIFPNEFNVFRKDRIEGAGGVFICIKKSLSVAEDPTLSVDAELVWIKIILSNMKQLYLCSFYRPPDHRSYPILELQTSLNKIVSQTSNSFDIILLGDFNFPSIIWSDGQGQVCSNPNYGIELNNLFLDLVNDIGLKQFVDSPTRQGKTLDLVLSTNTNIYDLEVVLGMSDHDAVIFKFSMNYVPDHQPPHKVFLYHQANVEGLKTDLLDFKNSFLQHDLITMDVEVMWKEFKDAIHESISKHIPQRTIQSNNNLPWINKRIKRDMKTRKCLYDTAKRSNSERDWSAYRKMKNLINNNLREAHNNYCGKLFNDSFGGSRRQFWKYIKAKHKNDIGISTIMFDGNPCTDPKAKATALNSYFESVFTKEDQSNVPTLDANESFPNLLDITFSVEGI